MTTHRGHPTHPPDVLTGAPRDRWAVGGSLLQVQDMWLCPPADPDQREGERR
jgi:hypothetical protein